MRPFERVTEIDRTNEARTWEDVRRHLVDDGRTEEEIQAAIRALKEERESATMWMNDRFMVHVWYKPQVQGWPAMLHLSVRRLDREPIHDWRDLQEIKNKLVGPECEGVELYPAESRLVDSANQYHLFVMQDPTKRFPFGYEQRAVSDASIGNSRNRPLTTTNERPTP